MPIIWQLFHFLNRFFDTSYVFTLSSQDMIGREEIHKVRSGMPHFLLFMTPNLHRSLQDCHFMSTVISFTYKNLETTLKVYKLRTGICMLYRMFAAILHCLNAEGNHVLCRFCILCEVYKELNPQLYCHYYYSITFGFSKGTSVGSSLYT